MTEPLSPAIAEHTAALLAPPGTPVVTFTPGGLRADPALLNDIGSQGEVFWAVEDFQGADAYPFASTVSQLICAAENAGCWEWSTPEVTGVWLDDDTEQERVAVTLCLTNGLYLTGQSVRHDTICPPSQRGLDAAITTLSGIACAAQQLYQQWCAVRTGIIETATTTGSDQPTRTDLLGFARDIAHLAAEGDTIGGEAFVMENDDAWATLHAVIEQARHLLGDTKTPAGS